MQESDYWKKDLLLRKITIGLALILPLAGWWEYKDLRQKEFQKAYYEQRIKTINKVFAIVEAIDKAGSDQEKLVASRDFWVIHHGYALTYLNNAMFEELDPLVRYINKCLQKFERFKADELTQCDHSANFYLHRFALAARRELSKGWDIDFTEISETHPWHGDEYHELFRKQ